MECTDQARWHAGLLAQDGYHHAVDRMAAARQISLRREHLRGRSARAGMEVRVFFAGGPAASAPRILLGGAVGRRAVRERERIEDEPRDVRAGQEVPEESFLFYDV